MIGRTYVLALYVVLIVAVLGLSVSLVVWSYSDQPPAFVGAPYGATVGAQVLDGYQR